MKALFHHVGRNQQRNVDSERNEVCENIAFIQEKKSNLYDLFLEREIDRDMLRKKIDELDQQIVRLENGKESFVLDSDDLLKRACDLIDSMREQPTAFLSSGDYYKKAEILRDMSAQVVMSREAATIEWKSPFSHLLETTFLELKESCDEHETQAASSEDVEGLTCPPNPDPL
jgi:septal ring factor EnvC (AmiA/AmiB activator)